MNTKTSEIPGGHVESSSSLLLPPSSISSSQTTRSSPPPSTSNSNYSYSNTFTMRRHDYSPLSSEEPNSRSTFNYDLSPPPLFNDPHLSHSERMTYFSSTSSSPLVPTSVILPDEPSRPLYNFETPVGLEPPPTNIPPLTLVPRRFGPVSSIIPNHHQHHHHHPNPLHPPHHHPSQFFQLQPPNTHSYHPRDLMYQTDSPSSSTTATATEAELKTLQRRVRELEGELEERSKLRDMLGVIPPDWEERTRFREQKFCSLNRAGNALCAWHDSRRERRLYAPRMAPHRTLNCGCTYEEAIFEESLSRNGVGSFWPGESVRMDPMLRNRLLELLQRTYRYRDGDFERNPDGTWREGQSATAWEERARRPVRRERS